MKENCLSIATLRELRIWVSIKRLSVCLSLCVSLFHLSIKVVIALKLHFVWLGDTTTTTTLGEFTWTEDDDWDWLLCFWGFRNLLWNWLLCFRGFRKICCEEFLHYLSLSCWVLLHFALQYPFPLLSGVVH